VNWEESSDEEREYARRRALKALRVYFAEKRWPRIAMSLILLATGGVGAGASWAMLNLGVDRMWMRYPLAVVIAWGVFLALLRAWMEVERKYFSAEQDVAALLKGHDPKETRERLEERDWSVFDWLDVPTDFGDGEGCAVAIFFFIVGAAILITGWAIISVLMAAPILFAEVFLDAVLVAALYKRMKGLERQSWLSGAVNQTIGPVATTALVLGLTGFFFGIVAPEAKSIGGVLKHVRSEETKRR
jgi:hypothetical protein